MSSNVDQLVEIVTAHSLFLKLKNVVENIEGFHNNEDVFSHSIKTAEIAKREREGKFVTNPEVQKLFLAWMEEDVFGMKRKDVSLLVALLHDCGKLLHYKENGETKPLITKRPQVPNQTGCPGHEYWGGTLVVKEILKDSGLNQDIQNYIASLVRLHDVFNAFFQGKEQWTIAELIEDVKSRAEGLYKEAMFNSYCDCYNASPFASSKNKIEELFNNPSLYAPRTYFIP